MKGVCIFLFFLHMKYVLSMSLCILVCVIHVSLSQKLLVCCYDDTKNHQPGIILYVITGQYSEMPNIQYYVHWHTVYYLFSMPNIQYSTLDLESIAYEYNLNNQLQRTESLTSWQPLSYSTNYVPFVSLREPTTRPGSEPAESTSHLNALGLLDSV